jgi:hypothetical protein
VVVLGSWDLYYCIYFNKNLKTGMIWIPDLK